MTPEQIVALKAPEATMAGVRGKVGKLLRQGYAKGGQSAVDEVDKAGERPIKGTSPEPADSLLAVELLHARIPAIVT
jgi:hypothetical protein